MDFLKIYKTYTKASKYALFCTSLLGCVVFIAGCHIAFSPLGKVLWEAVGSQPHLGSVSFL